MNRRRLLALALAAAATAPAAGAHTLYRQWLVYRQKHLLVGSHRGEGGTFEAAKEVVALLDHLVPEARARVARAPHPERIAALIGTRQMDVAVLAPAEVLAIRSGSGPFRPYGRVPLTLLADFRPHLLVAHRDFAAHHGWLLAAAMHEGAVPADLTRGRDDLPLHAGAAAFLDGVDMDALEMDALDPDVAEAPTPG